MTEMKRTSDGSMQLVSKGSTLQLSPLPCVKEEADEESLERLSCVKEEAASEESLERFVLNNHIDQFVHA